MTLVAAHLPTMARARYCSLSLGFDPIDTAVVLAAHEAVGHTDETCALVSCRVFACPFCDAIVRGGDALTDHLRSCLVQRSRRWRSRAR